jgi:hypothetical protein
LSLCTTAHPIHTVFAKRFGARLSKTTMRPTPRRNPASGPSDLPSHLLDRVGPQRCAGPCACVPDRRNAPPPAHDSHVHLPVSGFFTVVSQISHNPFVHIMGSTAAASVGAWIGHPIAHRRVGTAGVGSPNQHAATVAHTACDCCGARHARGTWRADCGWGRRLSGGASGWLIQPQ